MCDVCGQAGVQATVRRSAVLGSMSYVVCMNCGSAEPTFIADRILAMFGSVNSVPRSILTRYVTFYGGMYITFENYFNMITGYPIGNLYGGEIEEVEFD